MRLGVVCVLEFALSAFVRVDVGSTGAALISTGPADKAVAQIRQMQPQADALDGPLVPQLVPPPNTKWVLMTKPAIMLPGDEKTYTFLLAGVGEQEGGEWTWETPTPPAFVFRTEALDDVFDTLVVMDRDTSEVLFRIRRANPVDAPLSSFGSWSFRILAGSDGEDVRWTLNKDVSGPTWRVYRGRKREGKKEVYRTTTNTWSDNIGAALTIENVQTGWKAANAEQVFNPDVPGSGSGVIAAARRAGFANSFMLKVQAGEDAAVLAALSMVVDRAKRAKARADRLRRENHPRGPDWGPDI